MKVAQISAFTATVASLLTFTYGYSFSDVSTTTKTETENTGLTVNEESRIYGGTEANIDKYPFLASLRDPFLEETFCGGALIAPQYVLTAGHCIKTDMGIIVTFGTNDSIGDGSGEATSFQVVEGFRHPLYKKKEHLYDVGLLKLKNPIKRKTAKLCAADGSDNKVGTMGTVLGWGKTENSSDMQSPTLQQLTIPVISNAECGKFKKYVDRVTEGMLCAGIGDGRDTCNGDSGGPLIVDDDIIIGCVSWGSKCGQQAGIYTRLTYVMDYIEDILAGGDGSKFAVDSSSSGSQEVQLPRSLMPSGDAASGSNDLSWLLNGSVDMDLLLKMLQSYSGSGSVGDSPGSDSESGSEDTVAVKGGKTAKAPATKGKATKASSAEVDSESGSDDLSWLLDSDSGSGSEDTVAVKGGKATKTPADESASEETDVPATKGKATKVKDDQESGSDDLSWLLDSDSDSGSVDPTPVKGATKGKATKAPVAASGSHDLDWLFASESDSGSEDTVLVKGGKNPKATKATKASKTPIEEDSASTSGSEDSVHQSNSVHQSDQVTHQSFK